MIAGVQVLQYGDDPEVEPGQAAMRVFFDWPGRAEGGQVGPKTVHRFVTANAAALGGLGDGLGVNAAGREELRFARRPVKYLHPPIPVGAGS